MNSLVNPTRRTVIKVLAASTGVLALGVLPNAQALGAEGAPPPTFPHEPMAFVKIAADNSVTVIIKHLDKGQGIATGLATIVAEELDADWSQVKTEFAPAQAPLYANRAFGMQGTGGSTSVNNSWDELRYAGAAARQMLVTAAAKTWKVDPATIEVVRGQLIHRASGRHSTFGALAVKAAKLPVPETVTLKDPSQFTLIGTTVPRRVDSLDKSSGKARYTIDIRESGMVRAVIARSPRFGGVVKSFDDGAAKRIPGVVAVVQVPNGIAVVAKDTWSAFKGREALKIEWDDSAAEMRSSDQIIADFKALAAQPGAIATQKGDTVQALSMAAQVVEAEYVMPYLAHAPMEPLDAVIRVSQDGADIWAGSQFQTVEQATVAGILGLKPEQVRIHTQWAGGSFGRRACPTADYMAEAAHVAKAVGGRAPIQLLWSREDDIQGGRYRPLFVHRMKAGLDAEGRPIAWEHRLVGQSIMTGTGFEKVMVKNGIDATSVEGAANQPYAVPNMLVDLHSPKSPLPVLWWRSVGHSHTAYAVETFIDRLAQAAGRDPLDYRLSLLEAQPHMAAVLRRAADMADWGRPLAAGQGRGIAVAESFHSTVAQVAEVSIRADGTVKVDTVYCAVDCGIAVNPDVVRAQMEGGIGFALGAILRGAITLTEGKVDQSSFDGYVPLRLSEMPKVIVDILPSNQHPTGVGEPGVPPLGPAVANAVFAATGKRITTLPLSVGGLA